MRRPGSQRYAVLPPYASRWLLTQAASGQPVTAESVRRHAEWLRDHGGDQGRVFAGQVLGAWEQLALSAQDCESDAPTVLASMRHARKANRASESTGPGPGGGAA